MAYFKGIYQKSDFTPLSLPQVLLFGRSNVGKSSLINYLLGANVAKTSQTPGKTQAIHLYQMREFFLVDLPGYGYAKASKVVTATFSKLIIDYLKYITSSNYLVLLLIDHKVGMQPKDKEALAYLSAQKINFIIVLTKTDKTNQAERSKNRNELAPFWQAERVVITSSHKKRGATALIDKIRGCLL